MFRIFIDLYLDLFYNPYQAHSLKNKANILSRVAEGLGPAKPGNLQAYCLSGATSYRSVDLEDKMRNVHTRLGHN